MKKEEKKNWPKNTGRIRNGLKKLNQKHEGHVKRENGSWISKKRNPVEYAEAEAKGWKS